MVHKVEVGPIRELEITRRLEFTGSVDAWQEIEISSKARAQIVALPVEEGEVVRQGDLLFEMDARAEEIALARAKAELEKAEAELKKMTAGYLPEEIEEARRGVTAAQARLNAARDDWERLRPLAEQEVIPPSEATRARVAFEVAQSEVSRAQARLDILEQGFRSEEVQIAAAEVKVRRATVDDILRRLADHRITAGETGVVVTKLKETGEWANEGEAVLRMVVLDPMRLRLEVPQADLGLIARGQRAEMTVDGLGDRVFAAEVTNVIPQARLGTRNFPVMLRVDNSSGLLAAGMFARVKVLVGEPRRALVVPREAVRNLGVKLVVYRVDPLPPDFEYVPPAPPAGRNAPPGGLNPMARMAVPNGRAREIEVIVTDELQTEVAIRSREAGEIEALTEVVIFGNSRLTDGALLHRINGSLPGAG